MATRSSDAAVGLNEPPAVPLSLVWWLPSIRKRRTTCSTSALIGIESSSFLWASGSALRSSSASMSSMPSIHCSFIWKTFDDESSEMATECSSGGRPSAMTVTRWQQQSCDVSGTTRIVIGCVQPPSCGEKPTHTSALIASSSTRLDEIRKRKLKPPSSLPPSPLGSRGKAVTNWPLKIHLTSSAVWKTMWMKRHDVIHAGTGSSYRTRRLLCGQMRTTAPCALSSDTHTPPSGATAIAGPVMRALSRQWCSGWGTSYCTVATSASPIERSMRSSVSLWSCATQQSPCSSIATIGGDGRVSYSVPPLDSVVGSYRRGSTRHTAKPSGGGVL